MKIVLVYSTLFLFICSLSACKKDEIYPKYENADQYIQDIGFMGSVLIRKDSTDILRKGYGMANRNNHTLNDLNTKFRIGSMSKAFTTLGVIKLRREGLITGFDQKLSDLFTDFPAQYGITIRHLLRHQSGLPDHVNAFEELIIEEGLAFSPNTMFQTLKTAIAEDGLTFTPGSRHQYSNSNYLVLALLIEHLSGESYHSYINEMLTTIGMGDTHKGDNLITQHDEARGYRKSKEVKEYPMEIAFGAGDWVSNINDMEKWADAWLGDFLTPLEKQEVFTAPQQVEKTEFGMGWFTIKTHGKLVYFHGGDIDGFTSLIILYPESNGMLIALSNQEDQREKLDRMIEVFAKYEF